MEHSTQGKLKLTRRGWFLLVVLPLSVMGFALALTAALTPGLQSANSASIVGFMLVVSGIGVAIKKLNI